MSDWKEDSLHHKYDPLPEEPRHRKKARKRRVRSDHKHVYEEVCVDDHTFVHMRGERHRLLHLVKRCKACGRIGNCRVMPDMSEPPDGMPLYDVPDWLFLWTEKALPESMKVRD